MGIDRPDPISTEAGPLWFRGRANLAATLEQLSDPTHGLGSASELILSGGSAGGLAVYYHLDYVAAFVRHAAPSCRVTGFPDAGYFADLQDTTGKLAYRGFFQTADSTAWNTTVSGGSNAACLAANAGASSWKCLMAEYLTDYIETPMYVMNGESAAPLSRVVSVCSPEAALSQFGRMVSRVRCLPAAAHLGRGLRAVSMQRCTDPRHRGLPSCVPQPQCCPSRGACSQSRPRLLHRQLPRARAKPRLLLRWQPARVQLCWLAHDQDWRRHSAAGLCGVVPGWWRWP